MEGLRECPLGQEQPENDAAEKLNDSSWEKKALFSIRFGHRLFLLTFDDMLRFLFNMLTYP
jgi:hypothetical protein